jgi:hypothetical protein
MPCFLANLSAEIIYEIIKVLPLDNARNFLLYSSIIYRPGKHVFDQNYFRILLVRLSYNSLLKAEQFLRIEPSCFIQEIFIKIKVLRNFSLCDRLVFIFGKAFQASTKFNTVTIHYDPDYYDPGQLAPCLNTEILAKALRTALEHQ